ncbi:MAG: hypothetical protein ACP5H1_08460, partial [Acidilobus sp.]
MSQQGPQDKATPQAAQKPVTQPQAKPQAAAAPQAAKPPAQAAQQAAKPQAPQPVVLPPPPPVDVGTVAVVELLDAIIKLKRSGLLGMISYLADKAEDSFLSAAT